MVGQWRGGAIVPGPALWVVNDFAVAFPGQPGNATELVAVSDGFQQLGEGNLPRTSDRVIHIRCVDGSVGIQSREVSTPDDGSCRCESPYEFRRVDGRLH